MPEALVKITELPDTTLSQRVAKGVAWLDQLMPGWHNKVHLSVLDANSPDHCIAGQVFRDQGGQFFIAQLPSELSYFCPYRYGFGLWPGQDYMNCPEEEAVAYEDLTELWASVIQDRIGSN